MSTFRSTSRSAAVVPRHFAFRRGCIVVSGGLALLIGGGTLPTTARAAGLPVTTPNRKEPVRFGDEIVPLLAANCTACHNKTLAEGGLSMESLATMQKGGDSGPAIAAGKPAESVLFQRASHRQGDAMPPADNKVGAKNLTPEQLGLLERWIAEGAGGSEIVAKPINWRPPPKGIGGVIAVAMSADGQLTAAARGGRLTVFDTQSGTSLATLVDPALAGSGPDLAHADIISSAAFSPAEDMLATGSYRTIKFWKRAGVRKFADVAGSAGATGAVAARAGSPVAVPLADGRVAIVDTSAAAPALVRTVGAAGPAAVAVAISADGAVVAVAGQDKAVSLWQVADGAAAGRFTRPADIRSLTFAAGGKRLVTAEADGVLRVWESPVAGGDPAAVKPIKEIPGAAHPVVGLAELPAAAPPAAAGQPPATARAAIVVGGCGDGAVKLWNIDTGAMVRQVAHGGAVAGVAVSPDGSVIASVGAVPGVKLWKAADGAAIAHTTGDFRIAERLARKDADIAVLKRDVEHAKAEVAAAEKGKKAAADEIKKATDKLAAAEKNLKEKETPFLAGKMAREDAEKQAAAATMAVTQAEAAVAAATKGVEALPSGADAAAKAGPEQALAKARRDLDMAKAKAAPLVAAVTAKTEAEKPLAQAFTTAQADAERTKRFADDVAAEARKADAAVPARQADQQAAEAKLKTVEAERPPIEAELKASARPFAAVAFSHDGTTVLAIDAVPNGAAWNVVAFSGKDGQPRRSFPMPPQSTAIAAAAGGRIVTAGGPAQAVVHDAGEKWDLVRTIGGEKTPSAADEDPVGPPLDCVFSLAFSPDGATLASGSGRSSRSGEIKLWRTADGSLIRSIRQAHSDTVVALAFSRDGTRLASGSTDRFARIHLVADGKRERSLEGHTGHVLGVAWQADGRRLVTAGGDNVVKVWKVVTTTLHEDLKFAATDPAERTIQGATREVSGVKFLGEGDEFVATSGDKSIRVVNAATGVVVRSLVGAGDFVSALAVSGQRVAAGSQDGRLGIWKATEPKQLVTVEPAAKQ